MFKHQTSESGVNTMGDYNDSARADLPAEMHTILGTGCSVEGKLVCVGPTRLDGDVSGEIEADDLVVIEKNATVSADLNAPELIIHGIVKGNIKAVKRVSLAPSAFVEGDIQTPRLTIEEGAQVKGKVDVAPNMGRDKAAAPMTDAKPALAPFKQAV